MGYMMTEQHAIETADRCSRKRAVLLAAVALVFGLLSAGFSRVYLGSAQEDRIVFLLWALDALAIFLILMTGGGFIKNPRVRALMNDEITRGYRQIALASGFFIAAIAAFALLALPASVELPARTAGYIIISSSLTVALFVWAVLELRALRGS